MSRPYYPNDILVMPDELQAFAWSAPMRDLAKRLDMSDVGLKKILTGYGIVSPPQGHWNRVQAGRSVPPCPKAPPRCPGGMGRLRVDARFGKLLTPVSPMPSKGPFVSALVPEDLRELRAKEFKTIGRVGVPKSLDAAHRGLDQVLKQEQRRRDKDVPGQMNWDPPRFDTPLAKRQLRLFNAIFLALSKRGHHGGLDEGEGELHGRVIVGDTCVGLEIAVAGKHRTVVRRGYTRPSPDLPLGTPLIVRIPSGVDGGAAETWSDDETGKLETKIGAIAAAIIVAGEAGFRQGLGRQEAWAERRREELEERKLQELAELNAQRLANLHMSGQLLRRAQDIRELVRQVRSALGTVTHDVDENSIMEWEQWALEEADKLDPIISGQVKSHLRPATLPENGDLRV